MSQLHCAFQFRVALVLYSYCVLSTINVTKKKLPIQGNKYAPVQHYLQETKTEGLMDNGSKKVVRFADVLFNRETCLRCLSD